VTTRHNFGRDQDGHHIAVALLLKAALIQVSDYRLLGASGYCTGSYSYLKNQIVFHLIWKKILYRMGMNQPDTILEEDHSMTIPSKSGSN
jgi:hypothetical protein